VDDSFYRCLFPGAHRVLGRRLFLFSFWHLLTLHAVESPLLDPDAQASLPDLQVGVKICRSRWPNQPDLRPSLRDRLMYRRHRNDAGFLRREMDRFGAYRAAHEAMPEFWQNEAEIVPRRLTAPAVLARVTSLMRRTNLSRDEIWNGIAPGEACWIDGAISEQEGGEMRFVRDGDEAVSHLPDLTTLSEADLYTVVLADLGKERADAWAAARSSYAKASKDGGR
jgi:hypothetical protein